MTPAPDDSTPSGSLGGALKVIAVLAMLALAAIATLFVFDIIPRDALRELTTQLLALAAIFAIAAVGIAVVMRPPRRSS